MYFYSKAILPIIKGFEPTQIVQESKSSSLVDYRTYSCNTVECTNNFPSYVDCLWTQIDATSGYSSCIHNSTCNGSKVNMHAHVQ